MKQLFRLAGLAVLITPRLVCADPIRLVSDVRNVQAVATAEDPTGRDDSGIRVRFGEDSMVILHTADRNGNTASGAASLFSDISDLTHLSGVGTGTGTVATVSAAGSAHGVGVSMFNISFFVERSQLYDFAGVFASSGDVVNDGLHAFGEWTAEFRRLDTGQFMFDHISRESESIRERGVLFAGTHEVRVTALGAAQGRPGRGTGNATFRFTMDLDPAPNTTPEPASLLLLGTGVAGCLGVHRRSTASRMSTAKTNR